MRPQKISGHQYPFFTNKLIRLPLLVQLQAHHPNSQLQLSV